MLKDLHKHLFLGKSDLRDKMAMFFFAINILFVVVKKDNWHLNWSFHSTINFTYSNAYIVDEDEKRSSEASLINFVFFR